MRCGGWRVWTRSLTRPISRTVCRSTGDSAGAPGLFRVDADTSSCESEDATPGSPAWVRVLVRPGRVGVCGVLDHLAPANRCARLVRCFACAVSWATWLLFTGVPAWCVALRVRWPEPLGACSAVCTLGALLCVCGVLGHLAPVHRCARSVYCLGVRSPGPLGSCSLFCPLSVLCCVCGVLGHLAPVHRCARSVCCVACAVSLATWLLFTVVPAWCVALHVRCPWPLGSCSPVCPLDVLCCVCSVLGPLAPVHRFARPVCCAVSWATWTLFTGVLARFVVLWVACVARSCRLVTRPSGRWLLVAGRGWVCSGPALVHPDGGCS